MTALPVFTPNQKSFMIEIILLYFLTKNMGRLAAKKGLPSGKWKLYTVLAWIGCELLGLMLGVIFFGMGNLYGIMAFALVCAFGGYLMIKYFLDNKPDHIEEDINRIGVDELRP